MEEKSWPVLKMRRILHCGIIAIASIATTSAFTTGPSTRINSHNEQQTSIISFDTSSIITPRRITQHRHTQLQLVPTDAAFFSSPLISTDISSYFNLFKFSGNVPLVSSLVLNTILFFSLRSKLMTMLTPEGFAHSLALGTMLWTTLGWRGWTGMYY